MNFILSLARVDQLEVENQCSMFSERNFSSHFELDEFRSANQLRSHTRTKLARANWKALHLNAARRRLSSAARP